MTGFIHILAPGESAIALCGVVKPKHLGDPGQDTRGPWCEPCYDRHGLVVLADTDLEEDTPGSIGFYGKTPTDLKAYNTLEEIQQLIDFISGKTCSTST